MLIKLNNWVFVQILLCDALFFFLTNCKQFVFFMDMCARCVHLKKNQMRDSKHILTDTYKPVCLLHSVNSHETSQMWRMIRVMLKDPVWSSSKKAYLSSIRDGLVSVVVLSNDKLQSDRSTEWPALQKAGGFSVAPLRFVSHQQIPSVERRLWR